MADGGGSEQTQYRIAWDRENAGGYAALLTMDGLGFARFYPKRSAQAKGSHAFLGNGDRVTF